MNIFHSMALNNRTPEQIEEDRRKQHAWIKKNYPDAEILTTFIDDPPPDVKTKPLWYFGKGVMEYLSQADLLVVPYDWPSIRGVKCEVYVARHYGVDIAVMPDFDASEED